MFSVGLFPVSQKMTEHLVFLYPVRLSVVSLKLGAVAGTEHKKAMMVARAVAMTSLAVAMMLSMVVRVCDLRSQTRLSFERKSDRPTGRP